jgi:hypothetical protein
MHSYTCIYINEHTHTHRERGRERESDACMFVSAVMEHMYWFCHTPAAVVAAADHHARHLSCLHAQPKLVHGAWVLPNSNAAALRRWMHAGGGVVEVACPPALWCYPGGGFDEAASRIPTVICWQRSEPFREARAYHLRHRICVGRMMCLASSAVLGADSRLLRAADQLLLVGSPLFLRAHSLAQSAAMLCLRNPWRLAWLRS